MLRLLISCAVLGIVSHASGVSAETQYGANLDSSQVLNNASDSTATGAAQFSLNNAGTHLSYSVNFAGLDLDPIAANRTDPNDIIGIHIHLHVADVIGPHILNVFGFPSEDDADLVVDYENESLTGVYDMSDGIDPATGLPFFQDDPLATKLIANWLDELDAGDLYLAVHSRKASTETPPGVAIRGNIFLIPEPAAGTLLLNSVLMVWLAHQSIRPRLCISGKTSS